MPYPDTSMAYSGCFEFGYAIVFVPKSEALFPNYEWFNLILMEHYFAALNFFIKSINLKKQKKIL